MTNPATRLKNLKIKKDVDKSKKLEQLDFFTASITDATLKDDRHSMSVPFFTLSKRKDDRERVYLDKQGTEILKLSPSGRGLATIWDKDILLFCISQIMSAKNKNMPISQTIRVESFAALKATGRGTSRGAYENLEDALIRLRGTTIMTPIATGGEVVTTGFGFIEKFEITSTGSRREKILKSGEIQKKQTVLSFSVKLSDWIFNALRANEVLTLDQAYFALTGGVERRLYELARLHCGKQEQWQPFMETLFKKSGVKSSDLDPVKNKMNFRNALKKFRLEVKELAKINSLPGYSLAYDDKRDQVTFSTRKNGGES